MVSFALFIAAIALLVACIIVAFEVWMFVAALTNHNISTDSKAIWLIGMLIIHPFVAIAYYFVKYRRKT